MHKRKKIRIKKLKHESKNTAKSLKNLIKNPSTYPHKEDDRDTP